MIPDYVYRHNPFISSGKCKDPTCCPPEGYYTVPISLDSQYAIDPSKLPRLCEHVWLPDYVNDGPTVCKNCGKEL